MSSTPSQSGTSGSLARSAATFLILGLILYAALFYASEQLLRSHGRSNPFFKIATLEQPAADWVILGASHAMPLDFDGFNAFMEAKTGQKIVNLASPGTGPLYNRFVLEHFLRSHRARNVMYVVDSFAFCSRAWNEDRFADAKLLSRTPWEPALAAHVWNFVARDGVDGRAWLQYVTGFAKINNRDRFSEDRWEGEAQFDRVWRASSSAVRKRMEYLYPDGPAQAAEERYLTDLGRIVASARLAGARVVLVKMPVPGVFRAALPAEARFDAALARLAAQAGVSLKDFSAALDDPALFFDSDHLNRRGLTEFFERHLKGVFNAPGAAAPV